MRSLVIRGLSDGFVGYSFDLLIGLLWVGAALGAFLDASCFASMACSLQSRLDMLENRGVEHPSFAQYNLTSGPSTIVEGSNLTLGSDREGMIVPDVGPGAFFFA